MKEKGLDPEIILYLDTPPSKKDITLILDKLGMKAPELLRKGETEYKELNLSEIEYYPSWESHHATLFLTALDTWKLNKIFGGGIKSFRTDCL